MLVYLIRNLINDNCYVGLHRYDDNRRWNHHVWQSHEAKPLQLIDRKIKEYGEGRFEYRVLAHTDSMEDLKALEVKFITEYNSFVGNSHGYNLTLGGDGSLGFKMPQDKIHRGQMHYMFGKKRTEEEKEIRSKAMLGKNKGESNGSKRPEVRKILSELGRKKVGKLNPNYKHGLRMGVTHR